MTKQDIKNNIVDQFHTLNNLLQGITYQELVDTVYSNEAWRDEIRVLKVFDELLEAKIKEAKQNLRRNMNNILNELNS